MSFVFSSTALLGINKKGTLAPDENGYYDVVLGSLESPNSYGAIYKLQSARKIFADGSPFMRLIEKGMLFGEYGHPTRDPGMTEMEWMSRIHSVLEKYKSHHIKEVRIDEECIDRHGRKYIGIRGKVKPNGPYGHFLEKDFADPDVPVSFSIRSLTNDAIVQGRREKSLVTVVTWDYVNEPGLSQATKWDSPSLESFNEHYLDPSVLMKAIEANERSGYGLESAQRMKDTLNAIKATTTQDNNKKVWAKW